jgi:hypothetical protein
MWLKKKYGKGIPVTECERSVLEVLNLEAPGLLCTKMPPRKDMAQFSLGAKAEVPGIQVPLRHVVHRCHQANKEFFDSFTKQNPLSK